MRLQTQPMFGVPVPAGLTVMDSKNERKAKRERSLGWNRGQERLLY
jgi:hypothetical protein